jgi:hypothetical protein
MKFFFLVMKLKGFTYVMSAINAILYLSNLHNIIIEFLSISQIAFKIMTLSKVISPSCGHCLLPISSYLDWMKLHCTGCQAPFLLSNPA